jgi:hypothetical protein
MSDKKKAKADAKDAKGKGKGKQKGASGGISVASHPHARVHVRRMKGWGGLGAFAVAAYLSWNAGVPAAELGMRALIAGAAGYVVAWACSVAAWRAIVLAELRARLEHAAAAQAADDGSGA